MSIETTITPELESDYERGWNDALGSLVTSKTISEQFGIPISTITKMARDHNLGTSLSARTRVYTPDDVAVMRKLHTTQKRS